MSQPCDERTNERPRRGEEERVSVPVRALHKTISTITDQFHVHCRCSLSDAATTTWERLGLLRQWGNEERPMRTTHSLVTLSRSRTLPRSCSVVPLRDAVGHLAKTSILRKRGRCKIVTPFEEEDGETTSPF